MSAQALFNTLGAAGAGAGDARQLAMQQQAAAQQMALRLAAFQRQQQVSEALERYRSGELARQNTLAERPDWTPAREPYLGEDKQWHQDYIDRRSGKMMSNIVGTPLSNVNVGERDKDIAQRQKELQEQRAKLATELEASKAKHTMELARFKAAHPTAGRAGASGAVPLAAERWYKTLGGSQVDMQIKSLESMLKSMELTSLGGPEQLYQNGLYVRTQQQLAQLYAKANQIMDQAMQRARGAAGTPTPQAKGGSIVVTPEDMNNASQGTSVR